MKPSDRIITRLPLADLWNETGPVPARRGNDLSAEQIRTLLRRGPVQFVVADVGSQPRWIEPTRCFDFWKQEVQPHLYHPARPYLEDYPRQYYYRPSHWHLDAGGQVVVLEQSH